MSNGNKSGLAVAFLGAASMFTYICLSDACKGQTYAVSTEGAPDIVSAASAAPPAQAPVQASMQMPVQQGTNYKLLALVFTAGAAAGLVLSRRKAGTEREQVPLVSDIPKDVSARQTPQPQIDATYEYLRRKAVLPPAVTLMEVQNKATPYEQISTLSRALADKEREVSTLRRIMKHYGLGQVLERREKVAARRAEKRVQDNKKSVVKPPAA